MQMSRAMTGSLPWSRSEGRALAEASLKGVLLALGQRSRSTGVGLDGIQRILCVDDVHTFTGVLARSTPLLPDASLHRWNGVRLLVVRAFSDCVDYRHRNDDIARTFRDSDQQNEGPQRLSQHARNHCYRVANERNPTEQK